MDLFTLLVVVVVVGSRLLVPLLIPKYPLPAILACLIIDAVDQTVFQVFTPDLDLSGYQNYDKALDIYYLSIAYLSTFRNWTNQAAFQISQFLFYYRMIGLALFETTQIRALLLIFPNTFEYFFILISGIALFYKIKRLSVRFLIASAALIWIFIKLPQEYWLHVAQLDMTDFIKEEILNVSADTSWSQALSVNLWVIPVIIILVLAFTIIAYMIAKRLPAPDHKLQWSPVISEKIDLKPLKGSFVNKLKIRRNDLIEKIIFTGLLVFIFTNIFQGIESTLLRVGIGIFVIILVNAAVSHLLINSSRIKIDIFNSFIAMFVINAISLYLYVLLLGRSDQVNLVLVAFFAYIITLITVLYDRFKPYYTMRFSK